MSTRKEWSKTETKELIDKIVQIGGVRVLNLNTLWTRLGKVFRNRNAEDMKEYFFNHVLNNLEAYVPKSVAKRFVCQQKVTAMTSEYSSAAGSNPQTQQSVNNKNDLPMSETRTPETESSDANMSSPAFDGKTMELVQHRLEDYPTFSKTCQESKNAIDSESRVIDFPKKVRRSEDTAKLKETVKHEISQDGIKTIENQITSTTNCGTRMSYLSSKHDSTAKIVKATAEHFVNSTASDNVFIREIAKNTLLFLNQSVNHISILEQQNQPN